jgi:phosphopantothenoylcysteine decarboxylase / phosphopantothenate---cysteine ligase
VKVTLGVGGGIAAYKAAELARELQRRGATVQVVMTESAQQFITPLTFAALTNQEVITGLFDQSSAASTLGSAVQHIRVAEEHDVLVVAPATADLLANFAHGHAPDFLTTTFLAFPKRVVLAPAMNTEMWKHPATVENVRTLRERGNIIVEPEEGLLACGTVGPGRLAEVGEIADVVIRAANKRADLTGEHVLVTAGPTQEPIDPVRFLSNRSSGKMGYAIAEAARDRGAKVTLISGPVGLTPPFGVDLVRVRTAQQMYDAALSHLSESSIIVKSAAVADYFVRDIPDQKIKKTAMVRAIELDPTPDILAALGQQKGDRLLIGFAAETDHLISEAKRKLDSKHCDMVVANLVSTHGIGFEADENEVTIVTRIGDTVEIPRADKRIIADRIFDQALRLRLALHAAQ